MRPAATTTEVNEQPTIVRSSTAPPSILVKRPSESDSIPSLSSQSVDTPSRQTPRDMDKTLLRRRVGRASAGAGAEDVAAAALDVPYPQEYFTSDGGNLKLSGVGVFSPAASQPPSPTATRHPLSMNGRGESLEGESVDEGFILSRRRPRRVVENGG